MRTQRNGSSAYGSNAVTDEHNGMADEHMAFSDDDITEPREDDEKQTSFVDRSHLEERSGVVVETNTDE